MAYMRAFMHVRARERYAGARAGEAFSGNPVQAAGRA